ncbi:AsmA-like C-terminal region-containing protein [Pontibacter arcticus]|uniref:Uncharacterized protein n=1 Tax=Pontibacter arcticus TaxID=2080288 RepID=A0A364RJW4_9BACT|nr:AsmA-like C-terminal region-containing protein [Pontibacter arcticus]RAU84526.1 hypothetical protein DP923_03755 [Pontibacter arcticus]
MKKILFYLVAGVVAVISLAAGAVYLYQDKIIELFVTEANKHIKTKVEVGTISLSLFDKFPQVAVALQDVNVLEAIPDSKASLARTQKLYFTFNLLDVIRGKYTLKEVHLENGEVYIRVLPSGDVNYHIIAEDTTASNEDFAFDLQKINLKQVAIQYTDEQLNQTYQTTAHQLKAALAINGPVIDVQTTGEVTIHTLKIGEAEYFKNKAITLSTALSINRDTRLIQLQPSVVQVQQAAYDVAGTIAYNGPTNLDLTLTGKNTTLQSMLSLLPQEMVEKVKEYRSEGDIYFNGTIKGEMSSAKNPAVQVSFGCRNASFYHPDVKQKITKLSLAGSFTNGANRNANSSVLELKNLSGILSGRAFKGNLLYRNFNNPYIAFDVSGMLDVGYVLGLAKLEQIKSGSGLADVKVAFAGNVKEFTAKPGNSTLQTSGDVTLHNVTMAFKEVPMPFTNLNGNFMFKRNDVAVSDFKGRLGESDFVVNGMFRNVVSWLLLSKQSLVVEADFKSNYLNFDQLLSQQQNTPEADRKGADSDYRFIVAPNIAFQLSASISKVKFRRFTGENIKGEVSLRNQVVSSPNISFNAIGGNFAVKGTLNARNRNHVVVSTTTKLNNMSVDGLFYVFENFQQQFISDKHLKGQLTANIVSDVYFDSQLNPKTDLLQAEIVATIRNGQLINFEPMQKMSRFVKRSELANMRFAELHNSFWIQEGTIFIPEMDIRTNLSAAPVVSISGTHTFDQTMDYRIKLPLFSSKRPDRDAVFGVVAEDQNAGNSSLFLTLKGKENNFKIAYDKERVTQKIKTDLKKEGREIRDIFRGKKPEAKEKQIQLEEDEYFDFGDGN